MKPTIYMILVGVCLFFAGAGWEHQGHTCVAPEPALLSIADTQRRLVELGYDVKVDGKVGPQTLAAWDHAFCEQSAAMYFKD